MNAGGSRASSSADRLASEVAQRSIARLSHGRDSPVSTGETRPAVPFDRHIALLQGVTVRPPRVVRMRRPNRPSVCPHAMWHYKRIPRHVRVRGARAARRPSELHDSWVSVITSRKFPVVTRRIGVIPRVTASRQNADAFRRQPADWHDETTH